MSSLNSSEALMEAKWDHGYNDGVNPTVWLSPSEIFKAWSINRKPVKYTQCWAFAECLTCIMRFLGIPCRTVYGDNTHINTSLNYNIDMCDDFNNKDDSVSQKFLMIDDMNNFLNGFEIGGMGGIGGIGGMGETYKNDSFLNCNIYDGDDSLWNHHFWNEIYISHNNEFTWCYVDSCPSIISNEEPCKNKYILGPCKINSLKNGVNEKFDFTYLFSTVNSPIRLWKKETIIENEMTITIPYCHSIIYPCYMQNSIIKTEELYNQLKNKQLNIFTRHNNNKVNITKNYKCDFSKIYELTIEQNPIKFYIKDRNIHYVYNDDDIYYIQQILISKYGDIITFSRSYEKAKNIKCIDCTNGSILSILIIKDQNFWVQLIKIE